MTPRGLLVASRPLAIAALLFIQAAAIGGTTSGGSAAPALPQGFVDTAPSPVTGATHRARNGDELRRSLAAARLGDAIVLDAGAVFAGPFALPSKTGSGWITIRTSAENTLPAPGTRVDPSLSPLMPRLESATGSVISTEPGAHHYRLVGLEIRTKAGGFLYNLVELGTSERSLDALPHHIVIDRCYLHGDPRRGTRRGIALNGRELAVVDSYLADFKEAGADSQAIAGWNGPGPFRIVNNTLEGAGENILFGGADPAIRDLVPSDIEIRRNLLRKPMAWKQGDPAFEGTVWTVKNLFELKNARRVLVDGNVFENNWAQAQSGFAILFTVRNQDGLSPWSAVEDVTFTNNIVRHTGSAVNVLGTDDAAPSGPARRLVIRNNLFDDVGGPRWGGGGRLLQMLNGVADLVFEHNTCLHTGNTVTAEGEVHTGFAFRDNIVLNNEYGVTGSGKPSGRGSLDAFFPGALFDRNVIVGGSASAYPTGNFFPKSVDQVGFVDPAQGDYRLAASSRYARAATGAEDAGVDFAALAAAGAPVPSGRLEKTLSGGRPPGAMLPSGTTASGKRKDL
jgi:hypothetical protein